MKSSFPSRTLATALLAAAAMASLPSLHAQTAYGVDASGSLFSFNLATPGSVTDIGNLGFTPAAIDFRPGTSTLYAVSVNGGGNGGSLYTINTTSGASTLVGAFTATGLTSGAPIAFDFNPATLQGDGSIRIRLVDGDGSNFRLNSNTGATSNTDTAIAVPSTRFTGAAYTNSDVAVPPPTTGPSPTTLYYIDSQGDSLFLSSNPNMGIVGTVGTLGIVIGDDIGFDIYSGASTDVGYLTDTTSPTAANLYSVDLSTGQATSLGAVGRSFTGGFAVQQPVSAIPEPSSAVALAGALGLGFAALRRRRRAA